MSTCKRCNGEMHGDGFTRVLHCENANETSYEYHEADADPVYCNYKDQVMTQITENNCDLLIHVHGGIATVVKAPEGITCIQRDYDVRDADPRDFTEDEKGASCFHMEWTTPAKKPSPIENIDWPELREQKQWLLATITTMQLMGTHPSKAEGLLHLIDALQDYALEAMDVPTSDIFEEE